MENDKIDFNSIKIIDNSLFTKVLSNEYILKEFIETLLNISNIHICNIVREYVIDNIDGSKDVRLDLYAEDTDTVYDIDIQTTNKYDLPKRTRYYQSKLDRRYLHKGDKSYNKLRKSYIIFICTFNPFKSSKTNLPIYMFENMFISDNSIIKLNDMAYKVFINAECDVSNIKNNNLKSFIELIKDGYAPQTKSRLTDKMVKESNRIRQDSDWRREYMNIMQEYIEEVRKEERICFAMEMLKDGVNDSTILKYSKLTPEQLEQIKKEL